MTAPKRFSLVAFTSDGPGELQERDDGAFVTFSDYEKLRLAASPLAMKEALSNMLYYADEWYRHIGSDATMSGDFKEEIEAARALVASLDASAKEAAAPAAGDAKGDPRAPQWLPKAAQELFFKHDWCLTCHRGWESAPPLQAPADSDAVREAAQAVIDRWETPEWKDAPATAVFINRLRAALTAPAAKAAIADDQVKHMVNRFLSWKLPRDTFNPDCGISFDKEPYNAHTAHPSLYEPSGTNLFDATQADAMVRYMVEGMPGSTNLIQSAAQGGGTDAPAADREAVARAILSAEISHPKGLMEEKRSVGYYISVGLDVFGHPHDAMKDLSLSAADAILALHASTSAAEGKL